jgi:hypothetical protein
LRANPFGATASDRDLQKKNCSSAELSSTADRSALVVIVSAKIQGPGLADCVGGAFQCLIRDVENQNILFGAAIIISVHERTSIPSGQSAVGNRA